MRVIFFAYLCNMKYVGIRYASAARFAQPVAEPDPKSISDIECRKIVCPQSLSRLANVMGKGSETVEQGEDCLRLSVFTPAPDDQKRPVLVFIHGGAYLTGSAMDPYYDASQLAAEHDIVVVCISYRLGAFGLLYLPEHQAVNLAMEDQLCALRWISRNIHLFGGDADRITLMGQSAGGHSILHHIATQTHPLFAQAIICSSPYLSLSKRTMQRRTREFLQILGENPREASIENILRAQRQMLSNHQRMLPFAPVAPHLAAPIHTIPGLRSVLLTCQQDDASPFVPHWLQPLATRLVFHHPMLRYARRLAKAGILTHTRVLSWRHGATAFGASHCLELPLLFGNWDTWKDAPYLKGVTLDEYSQEAKAMKQWVVDYVKRL